MGSSSSSRARTPKLPHNNESATPWQRKDLPTCHYCNQSIQDDQIIHIKICLRCRNIYHEVCFGDQKTSVTCGHCASFVAQPENESLTPEISHQESEQQQAVFISNLNRAHAEVTLLNTTKSTNTEYLSDHTIGIPSTSYH